MGAYSKCLTLVAPLTIRYNITESVLTAVFGCREHVVHNLHVVEDEVVCERLEHIGVELGVTRCMQSMMAGKLTLY